MALAILREEMRSGDSKSSPASWRESIFLLIGGALACVVAFFLIWNFTPILPPGAEEPPSFVLSILGVFLGLGGIIVTGISCITLLVKGVHRSVTLNWGHAEPSPRDSHKAADGLTGTRDS